MKGLRIMKLTCAEAADVCTRAEYEEAGFIERLKLKIHLFFCRTCSKYNQNNKKLTSLLKKAEIKPCSSHEKNVFREKIKNGDSKNSL